ncbi:hypothetical protein DSM3645_21182 [Blastopirellula marina DSM 3645]|uniref:Uncharacterized protein n=1 Tax=Blastopirellula marina DSM 3645 TaxID=314230 RepID=A3ZR33_9BACT|nr:hypothetical protein DSM3645_21182 [Blastopirellula marina DSM 3645]
MEVAVFRIKRTLERCASKGKRLAIPARIEVANRIPSLALAG